MSPQEWAGLTLTILSIVALVAGGVKWYIGTQIAPMAEAIEDIRTETKTNGGSSMRDEIKSIKSQQVIDCEKREQMDKKIDRSNEKIDHMYDILIDYIANQNSKKKSKIKE